MSVCQNVSGAFPQPAPVEGGGEAERLNRACFCITLDRHALMEALNREVGSQDFAQGWANLTLKNASERGMQDKAPSVRFCLT